MNAWITEFESKMIDWNTNGGETKWACPCGFSGGPRNICAHRNTCLGWKLYIAWTRWAWDQKEEGRA